MPWWQWAIAGGTALASIWSGYKSGEAAEKTGEAQYWASLQNAQDMLSLANYNASLLGQVGAANAEAYRYVGELNAQAIEQSTMFNMALTKIETEEDLRRHLLQERQVAGAIRAGTTAAGIQVNTGTPMHFLSSQMHQAWLERKYIAQRGSLVLEKQYVEGKTGAFIAREEARIRGEVEMRNLAAQAELGLMESTYKALASMREGSLYQQLGQYNQSSAIWGGWSNAFSSFASIYGIFRTL